MANVQTPLTNFSPKVVGNLANKENKTPHAGMKTDSKLNFSPFSSGKKNKSFKILNDEEVALKKLCDKKIQPKKSRKNLATLQPSVDGPLTGQKTPQKDFFNKKIHKDDDLVDKAILLMKATESTSEKYWQNVAEERRLALQETLSENEKLYTDINNLKEENERLKKELNDCIYFKVLYENSTNLE